MIEFFLRRGAFVNLVTLILIGTGIYRFVTVKREAFPEVKFDIVIIHTTYPGASPEEVERLVTNPLEDVIRGVDNVEHVESYSSSSSSDIVIMLDDDLSNREVDRVVTDLQEAVNRVRDLPDDTERPVVIELSSDHPLISLSVVGGTAENRYGAAEDLGDALEDLRGVSRVTYDGKPPREIWVEANPAELSRRQLSLGEIARAISAQNVNLTAGSVMVGTTERIIRTLGGIWDADDVGQVIVRGNDQRGVIRVRDVARVKETVEDEDVRVRMNGKPAITLMLMKRGKADAIELMERVRKLKDEFAPRLKKAGLEIVETNDIGFFIERRLKVMKNNLLFGAFFIVAAMLLFLDWRLAIVAAIGIPLSLATALTIGVPMGVTFNLISVMAFIIVLGMLNDDAIVVADNIYRHMEMGKTRVQATLDGTREVIKPVLGAILTSCAAFFPFALVTGIMGKILIMFPIIVILCLISSLLEAFFILPSHALEATRFGTRLRPSSGAWYGILVARYRHALDWTLKHRGRFLLGFAAVFLAIVILAAIRVRLVMFPPGLIDIFMVQIEMPTGTNLETTQRALRGVERATGKIPKAEVDAVASWAGLVGMMGDPSYRRGTHLAQAIVYLKPQEHRKRKTEAIVEEVRKRVGRIPGARKVTFEKIKPGPPVGADVMVRIRGKELNVISEIAGKFKKELRKIEGVSDIRDSVEEGKAQTIIGPRPIELAYAGLDLSLVSRQLLSAYFGMEATKIRRQNEEVAVRVKLRKEDQKTSVVKELLVPNQMGRPVPLGELISLDAGVGEEYIAHYDYRRTSVVTASVDDEKATSHRVNRRLMGKFKDISEKYPGYDVIYGGVEEMTQESMASLKLAFVVALFLNLAILMAIFESWSRPLLILLTVPIGMTGVACALGVHGEPASLMALLGTVAMTGVVLNNAIVLVDFINRLRAQGKPTREALLEAGCVRLRPIVASSITTLLCLFPTAYGLGGSEPFVQPMALSMAWGLAFATPLTLFLIPIAYTLQDDLGIFVRTGARNLISRFSVHGRHRRRR